MEHCRYWVDVVDWNIVKFSMVDEDRDVPFFSHSNTIESVLIKVLFDNTFAKHIVAFVFFQLTDMRTYMIRILEDRLPIRFKIDKIGGNMKRTEEAIMPVLESVLVLPRVAFDTVCMCWKCCEDQRLYCASIHEFMFRVFCLGLLWCSSES